MSSGARYCGSTSTLKLTPAWRARRRRRSARPRRRRCTAGPALAGLHDEHLALAAAQAKQRGGPEHRRRGAVGRRACERTAASASRTALAAACASCASTRRRRRSGSGARTAGSRAPRDARARPRGSRRCRARRRARSRAHRGRSSARARGPSPPRPTRPASWAISANVRSSARKSGKRSVASASSTTPERHVGEVVALGDHLRADQHAAVGRLEAPQQRPRAVAVVATARGARGLGGAVRERRRRRGGRRGRRRRRRTRSRARAARRSVPAPWRATAVEAQSAQRVGAGSRWPQWWQAT